MFRKSEASQQEDFFGGFDFNNSCRGSISSIGGIGGEVQALKCCDTGNGRRHDGSNGAGHYRIVLVDEALN